jgi:hypothetical protein
MLVRQPSERIVIDHGPVSTPLSCLGDHVLHQAPCFKIIGATICTPLVCMCTCVYMCMGAVLPIFASSPHRRDDAAFMSYYRWFDGGAERNDTYDRRRESYVVYRVVILCEMLASSSVQIAPGLSIRLVTQRSRGLVGGRSARRERGVCKHPQAGIGRALMCACCMRTRSRFSICFRMVGARPDDRMRVASAG